MNAILRLVLETPRATRGSLAALLGLSPSSIVKYTRLLIDKGLIRESDREKSTGGGRSSVLELSPNAGLEIVVVLEATTVRGSLLDVSGQTLAEESAPSRQGVPREELLAAIFGLIDTLLSRAGGYQRRILGIGIGLGGYMDPSSRGSPTNTCTRGTGTTCPCDGWWKSATRCPASW